MIAGLTFYWDISHPIPPFSWINTIQNLFRVFGNQWFTVLPVWIFVICGHLIVLYFQKIEDRLNHLILNSRKIPTAIDTNFVSLEILKSLQWIKQLNHVTEIIHKRFSAMLMAILFISAITLLATSFYLIYSRKKFLVLIFSDATNMIDSFICICLMSYSSDRMQQAVKHNSDLWVKIRHWFSKVEW